jgi:hypothetical protein
MTNEGRAWVGAVGAIAALLATAGQAAATECGEARAQLAHLRGAQAISNQAKALLPAAERKVAATCTPKRATIAALPLGLVPVPQGNLSKVTWRPPEGFALTLSTRAGAPAGLVVKEPAQITVGEVALETTPSATPKAGEALVALARDAELTVEEPAAGSLTWTIALSGAPSTVPLSTLQACAAGKDKSLKLSASTCRAVVDALPLAPTPGARPERRRALRLGEWQYGWGTTLELGPVELGLDEAVKSLRGLASPAVPMALELSAPIPGLSDGKRLDVMLEMGQLASPPTVQLKLGHGCGDDDAACEAQRFAVEIWLDLVTGSLFFVPPPTPVAAASGPLKPGALVGKVADRLARAIAGQRLLYTGPGGRQIVTISDKQGEFRFIGLSGGEASVVPVGRVPTNILKGDEKRTVVVGLGESKVPIIYVNKLHE